MHVSVVVLNRFALFVQLKNELKYGSVRCVIIYVILLKLAAELPVAGEKKNTISFFRFIKGLWRIY